MIATRNLTPELSSNFVETRSSISLLLPSPTANMDGPGTELRTAGLSR